MNEKKRGLWLRAALALILCAAMAVPAGAMSTFDYLFTEHLHEGEDMTKEKTVDYSYSGRNPYNYDERTIYIRTEYQERSADFSTRVDRDAKIIDIVQVVIPEGKTLTVDKGVTLTIHGSLVINGKLNNKGTIIVGDSDAYRSSSRDADMCLIENHGNVVNSGTIELVRGNFMNEADGLFENKGVMHITNRDKTLTGLTNGTLTVLQTTQGGRIVNTGSIYVENNGGRGIRNPDAGTFENDGKIYKGETGVISGTIIGNRSMRLE